MNIQSISLDVSKEMTPPPVVRIGQGDKSGTTVLATVRDGRQSVSLSGMTARFCMRLPGGKLYVRDDNCIVSGSNITYTFDEYHCAQVSGWTDDAYFEILSGEDVIYSTGRFRVYVFRAAYDGATVPESWDTHVNALIEMITEAIHSHDTAEAARVAAELLRVAAEQSRESAESQRATSEAARESAESDRDLAESGRADAESARADAEAARVSEYAGLKQDAIAATTAANDAAEDARYAAEDARDAASALDDIVIEQIPLMTRTMRGGAKLGFGMKTLNGKLMFDNSVTWGRVEGTWYELFERPTDEDVTP